MVESSIAINICLLEGSWNLWIIILNPNNEYHVWMPFFIPFFGDIGNNKKRQVESRISRWAIRMTRPPASKGLIYIHHTQTALKGRVGTCACGNEHVELGCPIAAGCIRGIQCFTFKNWCVRAILGQLPIEISSFQRRHDVKSLQLTQSCGILTMTQQFEANGHYYF